MFGAIGMEFVRTRGRVGQDVRWIVKTRSFAGLDVGGSVKTRGFVDPGLLANSDFKGPSVHAARTNFYLDVFPGMPKPMKLTTKGWRPS